MKRALLFTLLFLTSTFYLKGEAMISPQTALQLLIEGNTRFTNDQMANPSRDYVARKNVIPAQFPFAIILSCSDSRVPPEILFDQGVGDLFIVRVAGNVVGPIELESIEFAAQNLHASLIVVLGHENCGAVTAVLNNQADSIPHIASLIAPAIKEAHTQEGNLLENAIKDNVNNVVEQLSQNEHLAALIASKNLQIVGGYYSLQTGNVKFLTP